MNNLQLSDYKTFDVRKITFSKPEVGSISGNLPKISFKRLRIGARYPDGSHGDLLIQTPENLLSFGLQENTDLATGAVSGYQFPICLWSRNGATEEEKAFTDKFNEIVEYVKAYLVEHRDEIEKYDLELTDLKKFNPLYWKMEKGKVVEGRGPMLYVKVMSSKKTGQILTGMIDDETNTYIDPMDLLNKRCYITGAIKIESIFIGNKISLQLKLFEAVIRVIDTSNSVRGLLRPNAKPRPAPSEEPADGKTEDRPLTPRSAQGQTSYFEETSRAATGGEFLDQGEEEYVEELYEETQEETGGDLTVPVQVASPPQTPEPTPVVETPVPVQPPPAPLKTKRGSTSRSRSATVSA